jgi:hypothetical protein
LEACYIASSQKEKMPWCHKKTKAETLRKMYIKQWK